MTLTVADIFCGAGGLSAGFASAKLDDSDKRFEVIFGLDNDKSCIQSFRHFHFPNVQGEKVERTAPSIDVAQVTSEAILDAIKPHPKIDVLIGGPNCQGVSPAGLRNPGDPRNQMLRAFIGLVQEIKPSWFVMENVPGLTHANNRALLLEIFRAFEDIRNENGGSLYQVRGDVLSAADYGVPQLRHRLFLIGTRTGHPIRFPPPTHFSTSAAKELLGISSLPYKTVRQAIGDLLEVDAIEIDENGHDPNATQPPNHFYPSIGQANRDRIRTIPEGGDWRSMPIKLLPERYFATRASDQKGAYGRLVWDWPAYTITNATSNVTAGSFTHPSLDRPLTVREAARLQSFSDDHIFYGSLTAQYRQIGNAVPPQLAQSVAEAILLCHHHPDKAQHWGNEGRIDIDVVKGSIEGTRTFPALSPRLPHPDHSHRRSWTVPSKTTTAHSQTSEDIWSLEPRRTQSPFPGDRERLAKLAEQPGNYRATKRAAAILAFLDSVPKDEIVRRANASEASVRKWVNGYFDGGIHGWRAYHTSFERIADYDKELLERILDRVEQIRQVDLVQRMGNGSQPHRLHMNAELLRLVGKFGALSTTKLIEAVEAVLGHGIGTVYVGDLLAIADVVLKDIPVEVR